MKAIMEIKDCRECPCYEKHRTHWEPFFEMVFSSFCKKAGRNICCKYVSEDPEAPVPSWCPYITERYKFIIEQLDRRRSDRPNDRHPEPTKRVKKCTSLRELASQILQELEKHCFSTFVYHTKSCPTERDLCLVAIISESRYLTYFHYPIWVFFDLDAEDMKIIENETERLAEMMMLREFYYDLGDANKDRAADIIKKFEQKESGARTKDIPLVLGTELAVPLAMLMADAVLDIPSDLEGVAVELKFIDHGNDAKGDPCPAESVELRYYWPDDSTAPMKELSNNNSEVALFRILKEIFGIKELTYFINDTIMLKTSLDT